jgi:hypothetical protein
VVTNTDVPVAVIALISPNGADSHSDAPLRCASASTVPSGAAMKVATRLDATAGCSSSSDRIRHCVLPLVKSTDMIS